MPKCNGVGHNHVAAQGIYMSDKIGDVTGQSNIANTYMVYSLQRAFKFY